MDLRGLATDAWIEVQLFRQQHGKAFAVIVAFITGFVLAKLF